MMEKSTTFWYNTSHIWLPETRRRWEIVFGGYPEYINEKGEEIERVAPHASPETAFTPFKDKHGYIAEKVVDLVIKDYGFTAEFSDLERENFYKKIFHREEWDLKWRGARIDVKGSPMSKDFSRVTANFNLIVNGRQSDYTNVDDYLFVKICAERNLFWILGLIGKEQFWGLRQEPKEGWNMKPGLGKECQYCQVHQLEREFRTFIYGV